MCNECDREDDSSYDSFEDFFGGAICQFLRPMKAITCIVCGRKGSPDNFEDNNMCWECHSQLFEGGLDEQTKEAVLRDVLPHLFQDESPLPSTTATTKSTRVATMSSNQASAHDKKVMAKEKPPATLSDQKVPVSFAHSPAAMRKGPPVAVVSANKSDIKPLGTKKSTPPVIVNPYAKKKKASAAKPRAKFPASKRPTPNSVRSIGSKGQKRFVMYG